MVIEAPVKRDDYAVTRKLQWLALSLTPGVGAGRGRKLVEHFGGMERLFAASLTELEAAGLAGVSAQSLALGNRWNWPQRNTTMSSKRGLRYWLLGMLVFRDGCSRFTILLSCST